MTEVTLQCLLAVLGRDIDLQSAVSMPLVHAPTFYSEKVADELLNGRYRSLVGSRASPYDAWRKVLRETGQAVEEGYNSSVLEDAVGRGLEIDIRPATDRLLPRGYWAGIRIDPGGGEIQGGRTRAVNGAIEKVS
jgi:gamma-glutamyltranspeptidase / glutathione hydrolase